MPLQRALRSTPARRQALFGLTIGTRWLRLALLLVLSISGWAQTEPPQKAEPHGPVLEPATSGAEPWEYSLTVDGVIPVTGNGYASPTFTADHKWLHLEARYNYENFRTGSLWAGYNFSWGKTWQFEITPMIGGVFGRTNGIAPGCEASVAWKKLTLSMDNEYVFDTTSKSGNFYYAWPQLTYQALSWLRVGAVSEHSKTFHTKSDLVGGFLVGVDYKRYQFTTYVLNPGVSGGSVQLELAATF
jgi:hypothetical protein